MVDVLGRLGNGKYGLYPGAGTYVLGNLYDVDVGEIGAIWGGRTEGS